jgi:hypothetical protein
VNAPRGAGDYREDSERSAENAHRAVLAVSDHGFDLVCRPLADEALDLSLNLVLYSLTSEDQTHDADDKSVRGEQVKGFYNRRAAAIVVQSFKKSLIALEKRVHIYRPSLNAALDVPLQIPFERKTKQAARHCRLALAGVLPDRDE